jgi:hypothetical protein
MAYGINMASCVDLKFSLGQKASQIWGLRDMEVTISTLSAKSIHMSVPRNFENFHLQSLFVCILLLNYSIIVGGQTPNQYRRQAPGIHSIFNP